MVLSDNGVPDPPDNLNTNLSANENIFIGDDSGESDEEYFSNEYDGYEALPLGPEDVLNNDVSEDGEEDSAENSTHQQAVEDFDTLRSSVETEIVKEVWSGPAIGDNGIEMDDNKIDEVKRAMLTITLPPSAIPDWAKHIPEDQWKEHLLNKIQNND